MLDKRLRVRKRVWIAWLLSSLVAHSAVFADVRCETTKSLKVQYRDFLPTAVQIISPCAEQSRLPYVVFASYLSLVDKDYYSGARPESAALEDRQGDIFLFGSLARELTSRGFSVVKYDALAVHADSRDERTQPGEIVNQDELLRITRNDFSGLLHSVVQAADLVLDHQERRPIIFVVHSGGAFTVGDYLEKYHAMSRENRKIGFVGISPAVSSETGTKRSHRDYWVRSLEQCLKRSNHADCAARLKEDPLYERLFNDKRRRKIDEIFAISTGEGDLVAALNEYLTGVANEIDLFNLKSSEEFGYINGKYKIRATLINELMFREPSANAISCRATSARLIFGSNDLSLSWKAEAEAWQSACGSRQQVIMIDGVGHSLGVDRYFGPIHPMAKSIVIDSILKVADDLP